MKYYEMLHSNKYEQLHKKSAENTNDNKKETTSKPKYELNDKEYKNVIGIIKDIHEKYFSAIELSKNISESFIRNIPRKVYDEIMHADRISSSHPDALNPAYWLICMCIDTDENSMGKFVVNAVNSIEDDDYPIINEKADKYDSIKEENIE